MSKGNSASVAVMIYRATSIASSLHMIANPDLKANPAGSASELMSAAMTITGKTFDPTDYAGASTALKLWASKQAKQYLIEQYSKKGN